MNIINNHKFKHNLCNLDNFNKLYINLLLYYYFTLILN
ncbi:hypothetical protein [Plasmodium yoelii yoelii]|uniref:Uncharacterized protein n=1 Tax=Plasmodium yoelii yoelii TaxID=73239 RepID=Q7RBC3_PLAYO|nr:hypothetical protein [Plasmodium yoelii yoelii]